MDLMAFREAFAVLKEAGFSDEALCYEMQVVSTRCAIHLLTQLPGGCRKNLLKYLDLQQTMDLFIKYVIIIKFIFACDPYRVS